jgi:hypothetical protein
MSCRFVDVSRIDLDLQNPAVDPDTTQIQGAIIIVDRGSTWAGRLLKEIVLGV